MGSGNTFGELGAIHAAGRYDGTTGLLDGAAINMGDGIHNGPGDVTVAMGDGIDVGPTGNGAVGVFPKNSFVAWTPVDTTHIQVLTTDAAGMAADADFQIVIWRTS